MQMIPFRGYSIPPLTFEEYRNLNELQEVVEPAVAALAAERATQEQIKEMESWASYEYHVGQKNSYYKFLEWNRNFHICIATATRNHAFLEVVRNVQTRLMRYYYLVIVMDSYGPALIEEHQQLVRAIKAGNPKLAATQATEHLANTSRRAAIINLASANHCIDPTLGNEEMGQVQKTPARASHTKKRLVGKRRRELLSR